MQMKKSIVLPHFDSVHVQYDVWTGHKFPFAQKIYILLQKNLKHFIKEEVINPGNITSEKPTTNK